MKKLWIALLLLLAIPGFAWAAGTCTVDYDRDSRTGTTTIVWSWTSDASGDVTGTDGSICVTGTIAGIQMIPDDTDTPTDAYDVTVITDVGSFDVLVGLGANMSENLDDSGNVFMPVDSDNSKPITLPANTCIHPVVDNAGSATSGIIKMVIF